MTQLAQVLARDLEADKLYLLTMISLLKTVRTSVELEEEPGEVLITLLMKPEEIEEAVREAVKQVFRTEYSVSEIHTSCEKRMIHFVISSCEKS